MASTYCKAYSPYSKGSPSQNQQPALRSKAFSHVDNIQHNYSQYQNSNLSANQDKIAEIKKKYQKILAKSNNKTNQENQPAITTSNDVGKSVSKYQNYDQNSRWSQYNKSFQTPTTNKDRKAVQMIDIPQVKNLGSKPYALRQYVNPAKTQVKSHLENNRMTLQAMKSQLQSKLKDLSAKTNVTSQLRNPSILREEKKVEETSSYQAILNKYSKDMSQNRNRNSNNDISRNYAQVEQSQVRPYERKQTFQQKIKETTISSYVPKQNIQNNKPNQKSNKPKQLSIISQISSSNHSDMQNTQGHHAFKHENKDKFEDNFKNSQSYLIIEKQGFTQSKYQNNNWMKNTTSFIDTKDKPKEQNTEFQLKKLQASQGLSIKRTTTQQHFMNLNKINHIQTRLQQKQKSNDHRPSQGVRQQTIKVVTEQKQTNNIQSNRNQLSADEKTQIQKLKEKYNIKETTKYTNPYREKRPQKSVNNEKNEQRNSQTISKEIQKLDSRIKQIQQNKKDMNINFRPYEISKSVSKVYNISESNKTSTSISSYEKAQIPRYTEIGFTTSHNASMIMPSNTSTATATVDKNKYNARYQAYLERVKPLYSQITLPQGDKTESNGFAIKLLPVQNTYQPEQEAQKSFSDINSKSRMKQYINKVELQNRTDTGIQQRKKRLQQKVEINNNVKLLVKTFGQQAVYDEVFRNNKIWFASQAKEKKWAQLKNELTSLSINLNDSQLKEIFALDQSQNNPFFSVSDNKCNIKSLAQSYKQAQRHWEQKILHKFNRGQLQRQGFSTNKIDYDKKGCIQVQDLVRFLNIQSGTFLRNRDVSIIFKRMCNNGNKLMFDQMLNLITM